MTDSTTQYICSLNGIVQSNNQSINQTINLFSTIIEDHSYVDQSINESNEKSINQSNDQSNDQSINQIIQQRRIKLDSQFRSINQSNNQSARPLMLYERVYMPIHPDNVRTELRAVKDLTQPDSQWIIFSQSPPVLPGKHETIVRSFKSFQLAINQSIKQSSKDSNKDTDKQPNKDSNNQSNNQSNDSLDQCLQFFDYRFDYEFIREGWCWTTSLKINQPISQTNNPSIKQSNNQTINQTILPLEVRLFSLVRFERKHDFSSLETLRGLQWLTEARAQVKEAGLARAERAIRDWTNLLAPIVIMSNVLPD